MIRYISELLDSENYEMKKLKSNDDTLDRFSELPDSLILLILSFMEMRDVVGTTLLSKRWKDLWTTIPCLIFNEFNILDETRNFINRALLLWKGTEMLKFKITFCDEFDESLSGDMDLWVRFAKERRVEEFNMRMPYDSSFLFECGPWESDPVYMPPQCMYSCSSIRKLSLVGCNLQIHGNVHWDQLKILKLDGYWFSEHAINQVVSGTPQLEILKLRLRSHENLSIRSSSLKKLSIWKHANDIKFDPSNYRVLTIWAPKLEALVFSGAAYSECLLMDVSSLTDATLGFEDKWDAVLEKTLRQILPTFQHVEAVTLSAFCIKMLGVMKDKYSFSPLPNVKLLNISGYPIEPNETVGLLEIFPKLKMLVLDWHIDAKYAILSRNLLRKQDIVENYIESEANILRSFLMHLRKVEITWKLYDASMFQFIEFMLKHATMIQKIVIQKRGNKVVESKYVFLAAQKLLSLQRSFPTVEFNFHEE